MQRRYVRWPERPHQRLEFDLTLILRCTQSSKKGKTGTAESDGEDIEAAVKRTPKKAKSKQKAPQEGDDPDNKNTKKKPRIKIKLPVDDDAVENKQTGKDKKGPPKRKRDDIGSEDDESLETDTLSSPIPKKRKKVDPSAKPKKSSAKGSESSDDDRPLQEVASRKARPNDSEDGAKSRYLDLQFWKKCREGLNDTYKAARKNLTQHGGWELPPVIPDDKFAEVAIYTLDKVDK